MAATRESLVFDSLDLNAAPLNLLSVDLTPPRKLWEWARSADQNGQTLVRPPLLEQRQVVLTVRVRPQTTMDAALDLIGAIVDRCQAAERDAGNGGRGLELVYSATGSTREFTFYVQGGELSDLPGSVDGGWLRKSPQFGLTLFCEPAALGEWVVSSTTTSTEPLVVKSFTGTEGEIAAEARLTVTDSAAQPRDHVEFFVESSGDLSASLLIDSASLTTTGYAGSSTTRTGAYSASGVVRATLSTAPVVVASTGELTHQGSFRIKGRLYASAAGVQTRLVWREGRDSWTANEWQAHPVSANFAEFDFGTITVQDVPLGTQSWQARIEAKASTAGTTLDGDYLIVGPVGDGYGKARKVLRFETPTVFSARDEFVQTAGNLTGKTLPAGGTWGFTGGATDFTVEATGHTATRNTSGDTLPGRQATAGTSTFTNVGIQLDAMVATLASSGVIVGAVARHTDANNFVYGGFGWGTRRALVTKYVSGVETSIATSAALPIVSEGWWTIRFVVFATGAFALWVYSRGTTPAGPTIQGHDSALATGGSLASGKTGFVDWSNVVGVRSFDNFSVWVPETDAAINTSQSIEFRSVNDPVLREDSTGTYWGRPAEYNGSRFYLPPGDSRVAVKARRRDVELLPDDQIADSTQVTVAHRPRYIAVPRV